MILKQIVQSDATISDNPMQEQEISSRPYVGLRVALRQILKYLHDRPCEGAGMVNQRRRDTSRCRTLERVS